MSNCPGCPSNLEVWQRLLEQDAEGHALDQEYLAFVPPLVTAAEAACVWCSSIQKLETAHDAGQIPPEVWSLFQETVRGTRDMDARQLGPPPYAKETREGALLKALMASGMWWCGAAQLTALMFERVNAYVHGEIDQTTVRPSYFTKNGRRTGVVAPKVREAVEKYWAPFYARVRYRTQAYLTAVKQHTRVVPPAPATSAAATPAAATPAAVSAGAPRTAIAAAERLARQLDARPPSASGREQLEAQDAVLLAGIAALRGQAAGMEPAAFQTQIRVLSRARNVIARISRRGGSGRAARHSRGTARRSRGTARHSRGKARRSRGKARRSRGTARRSRGTARHSRGKSARRTQRGGGVDALAADPDPCLWTSGSLKHALPGLAQQYIEDVTALYSKWTKGGQFYRCVIPVALAGPATWTQAVGGARAATTRRKRGYVAADGCSNFLLALHNDGTGSVRKSLVGYGVPASWLRPANRAVITDEPSQVSTHETTREAQEWSSLANAVGMYLSQVQAAKNAYSDEPLLMRAGPEYLRQAQGHGSAEAFRLAPHPWLYQTPTIAGLTVGRRPPQDWRSVPEEFTDPITGRLMEDAVHVVDPSGNPVMHGESPFILDRSTISKLPRRRQRTGPGPRLDPYTKQPIGTAAMAVTNTPAVATLRDQITYWQSSFR